MQVIKDLIKNYYDSFNQQDLEKFLSYLSDDVVHDINQGGSEIGKEKFATFMHHMYRCYQETVKDLVIMVSDDGSHAAAEFIIEGTYLVTDEGLPEATGQQYQLPIGAFFRIKDGKIARVTNYYNLQEWLKQVGK
jgi:steroid delta-isomerase-like uncharacterized protein